MVENTFEVNIPIRIEQFDVFPIDFYFNDIARLYLNVRNIRQKEEG